MCRLSATVCLTRSPTAAQRGVNGVAERLALVRDPRDRRGRRHSPVLVLLTSCCAVLSGARSYLAAGQWGRHAPLGALARHGVRAAGPLGVRPAPSRSTIRRLLTFVYPGGLADLLGCDPSEARSSRWQARRPAALEIRTASTCRANRPHDDQAQGRRIPRGSDGTVFAICCRTGMWRGDIDGARTSEAGSLR